MTEVWVLEFDDDDYYSSGAILQSYTGYSTKEAAMQVAQIQVNNITAMRNRNLLKEFQEETVGLIWEDVSVLTPSFSTTNWSGIFYVTQLVNEGPDPVLPPEVRREYQRREDASS